MSNKIKNWFINSWHSWSNCVYFRLTLRSNFDRIMFFEELSIGHIQMTDKWIMSQPGFDPYNLSGRDPHYSYMIKINE